MKNLSIILFTITIASLIFSGGSFSFAEKVRGVTDDTIKIGVILDQTGPACSTTLTMTEATRTYFRHINDQGGINGRKVRVIVEDDRYTIPGAIAAFKKLIFRDEVLSVLFCGGTGQILALMQRVEKHRVPVVTISLSERLTTPVKRYIFIPAASYDDGFKIIVDYIMRDLKAKDPSIAFVYPDVEFGKTGLRATEKYLPHYNVKLTTTVVLNITEIDATSQVLILKKAKPDFIILHDAMAGVVSFFKAAKKYRLKSNVIGSCYVDEGEVAATGDAMKDALAIGAFGCWYDDTPGMADLRKITRKYHPDVEKKVRSYTQGWVTSMICAEGLKRAGRDLTPETLVEALETFKNFRTGGISGLISYSKEDHKGGTTWRVNRVDVKRQTFIPVTGYREPAFKD